MCGISGIWGGNYPDLISRMVSALHHRGPDDSGIFGDECVSLGMARLAIIDIKPSGHQPMSNPEQTIWIVYNGEVYNFLEQRRYLEKLVISLFPNLILKLYYGFTNTMVMISWRIYVECLPSLFMTNGRALGKNVFCLRVINLVSNRFYTLK